MFSELATIPVETLPTDFLETLQRDIKKELRERRKLMKVTHRLGVMKNLVYKEHKLEDLLDKIACANAEFPMALPHSIRTARIGDRTKYLPYLLSQPWNDLFCTASSIPNDSYVYLHIDPRKKAISLHGMKTLLRGEPFYVGKGIGKRAWDLKRNQGHGKRIRQILAKGFPAESIVQVIREGLSEKEALVIEAKLIYFFGSIYDESCAGTLFNLIDHIRPDFKVNMRILPIRSQCKRENI